MTIVLNVFWRGKQSTTEYAQISLKTNPIRPHGARTEMTRSNKTSTGTDYRLPPIPQFQ